MANPSGFNVLWQYFGWSNQALSVFSLWAVTVYLARNRKCFWIMLLPAIFMTVVCTTFLFVSPSALHLSTAVTPWLSAAIVVIATAWFVIWYLRNQSAFSKL